MPRPDAPRAGTRGTARAGAARAGAARAGAARAVRATPPGVALWVPVASLILIVAGLAVSAYLTAEHYSASSTLACPETGVVNCQKVTTSAQSVVFGVPVAVLGLVFFAAMLPLCLPVAWRSARPPLRWGRVLGSLVGVGFVFYLVYTELFTLGAICLWCTAVHVLTVALFAVVAIGAAAAEPAD